MKRLALGAILLAGCNAPVVRTPPPVPAPNTEVVAARPDSIAQSAAAFPTSPPEPGPAPELELPAPARRTLANGLTVLYVAEPRLPLVHATLVTRGGQADAPAGTPEMASFTASMLDEGAGGRGALELSNALDLLGASLFAGAGWDAVQVDLEVLEPRFAEALDLMADVVVRPAFPQKEVDRVRAERLTDLERASDEARIIAGNAFSALVYGSDSPYGRLATTESTKGITRAQLVAFHERFYRPGASTLVLVGAVDPATMQPLVEHAFGSWDAGTVPAAIVPAAPDIDHTTIYLIDKPGAAQSEIRIGHPGVARDTPDYFAIQVLNTLLGGSFTSRLNMNLREEHGYSYGAGSNYSMRIGAGPFIASSAVVTAKTDSAVLEFFNELRRVREEPVPAEELERAKRYVALGLPRRFETDGSIADALANLTVYDLDADFYDGYVQRIMAVTAADVQRAAQQYVRPDHAVVVVVGDRKLIEPGLRALGIAPVVVKDAAEFVR